MGWTGWQPIDRYCDAGFAGMSYVTGNVVFSDYLNIVHLPGKRGVNRLFMAIVGAAMGFYGLMHILRRFSWEIPGH